MKATRIFENEFMKLEEKNGIVFGTYKTGPITLELAKKVVINRLEFTNNTDVPLLVTEEGLRGIEREARNYLSSEEGMKGILAGAIVTRSVFSSHLANFFMKIAYFRAKVPAKMFASEKEAVEWLQSFIEKEN